MKNKFTLILPDEVSFHNIILTKTVEINRFYSNYRGLSSQKNNLRWL